MRSDDAIGPRSVHRKALLKALAEELPTDSIRFCCKITAIETQVQEGSPFAVVHMEDGTVIKAKVRNIIKVILEINQKSSYFSFFLLCSF